MVRGPLAALVAAALGASEAGAQAIRDAPVEERVSVERVVISGRVIDRFANPVLDLKREDFRLRVDGRESPIDSVEWLSRAGGLVADAVRTERPPAEDGTPSAGATRPAATSPRLIVMLFQWEIAGQKDVGTLRMMRQARLFLDSLDPDDRVAVFSFGSSLRLIQDLTTDRAAVRAAIQRVRFARTTAPGNDRRFELSSAVARQGSRDSIETALVSIADSLREIPGPKTLLFFGWTAESHRSSWRTDYPSVVEAIGRAETSVFALDVSDGRHRLAAGMRQLARDTGGLYQETHDFPDLARERAQRAFDGSYEIVFRPPAGPRGWHRIEIELSGRSGTLLFPRWYRD